MSNYRILELVDLAIGAPTNGVVNFKVLKLILKIILKKSGFGDNFVHYKAPDRTPLMERILEESGKSSSEKSSSEKLLPDQKEIADTLEAMNKIIDDISSEEIEKIEESTNTDSQIWPVPELQELFTSVKHLEEKLDKVQENVKLLEQQMKHTEADMERKLDSKVKSLERQMKRSKTDIERKPDSKVESLERLKKRTKTVMERKPDSEEESLERQMKDTKTDEENKSDSEDEQNKEEGSSFDSNRDEFQEAFESMRHSIKKLAKKLKDQEQSSIGPANKEAINKLCEKAAEEEIAKKQGDFNDRLKSLAFTVNNLTNTVKDILNPKAAGVTKCVTCGRSARLPDLDLLSEIPGDTRADRNVQKIVRKKPVKKKENQKQHQLKFTLLSLDNIKKANQRKSKLLQQDQEQTLTSEARIESQGNEEQERRPIDVFNTGEVTSAFMPLRYIPDPTRRGTLLSDAIYMNPEVMSVSVIGTQKPQQLRFQTKPE